MSLAVILAVVATMADPAAAPQSPRAVDAPQAPPPRATATEAAQTAPFVLASVVIDAPRDRLETLQAAIAPFVGQTIDADGLARIRAAASTALGEDTALPLIALDTRQAPAGILVITAIPGRVGRVAIEGDAPDGSLIHRYAAPLAAEAPLSRRTAERQLSLISDIPGVKTTLGQAVSSVPGAVDLTLDVAARRWMFESTLDNRGSRTLGRVQGTAAANLYGALTFGDHTRAAVTVPDDLERFQLFGLSHRRPIGGDGAAVNLSASHLRTRTDAVSGDATTLGASVSWPWVRGYRDNVNVSAGLDGLDSDNAVFGNLLASERVRSARVSIGGARTTATRTLSAAATLSQGIDGLGAEAPELVDSDYAKLNLRLDVARVLGSRFRIGATVAGQVSPHRVPTAELFSLGGAEFGRGFSAGLLVGDSGYGGKAELAWRPTGLPRPILGSEVYLFGDGGAATVNARGDQPSFTADLLSVGTGVRIVVGTRLLVELEIARALEDPRPNAGDSTRAGFAFSARF